MGAFRKLVINENSNSITSNIDSDNNFDTMQSQIERFDTTYSNEKVRNLLEEFDSITINESEIEKDIVVKNDVVEKTALSVRSKIYLTSAVLISALLVFLAIYNIFVINNLNSGIKILEGNINNTYMIYESVEGQYQALTSLPTDTEIQALIDQGYVEISSDNIKYLELGAKSVVESVEAPSNWFDAFCNFVSGLFGG